MFRILTEKDLVKGCKKGKRQAQKQVYEKFAPKMLVVCMRYMQNQFEAEDALTNAFVKVFKKIDQFKEEGSFEGWIRRIVVNECLSLLRKKRLMYAELNLENMAENVQHNPVDAQYSKEDLMSFINELPTGYKTVFNLYAIEGYSHKEIAEKLNISENTSKSQLSRARNLLQKLLLKNENKLKEIHHG